MSITVLCPTRGRPKAARELIASFRETATLVSTDLVLVVDADDPALPEYCAIDPVGRSPHAIQPVSATGLMRVTGGTLTAATNEAAARVGLNADIIGHVGDDHRFQSVGWDRRVSDALTRTGVAYGDDGYWGDRLATAAFLTADIPRVLGWLANPACDHYGIDDTWGDLGRAVGNLVYLRDVKITHHGPRETRRRGDAVYWRAQGHHKADSAAYYAWRDGDGLREATRLLSAVPA